MARKKDEQAGKPDLSQVREQIDGIDRQVQGRIDAFFIDVAGHCDESPLKDALAEGGEDGDQVRVPGSYPVAIR